MSQYGGRRRQNLPLDLIALRRTALGGDYSAREAAGPSAGLPPDFRLTVGSPPPGTPPPGANIIYFSPEQFEQLLIASWRRGNIIVQPFIANAAAPLVIRPQEKRFYLFIQNQSAVNQISVNFGRDAGALGIVPVDGVILAPNLGYYEPLMVSQDTISVRASGAGTPGVLLYSSMPG